MTFLSELLHEHGASPVDVKIVNDNAQQSIKTLEERRNIFEATKIKQDGRWGKWRDLSDSCLAKPMRRTSAKTSRISSVLSEPSLRNALGSDMPAIQPTRRLSIQSVSSTVGLKNATWDQSDFQEKPKTTMDRTKLKSLLLPPTKTKSNTPGSKVAAMPKAEKQSTKSSRMMPLPLPPDQSPTSVLATKTLR